MKLLREWITKVFKDTSPKRILFRVDAGRIPGLSFGHLVRCLILSDVIKEIYHSNHLFLMRHYEDGVIHAKHKEDNLVLIPNELTQTEEKKFLFNNLNKFKPCWIIFDLPYSNIDTSYFSFIRSYGIKILFIDDALFVNPGVDVYLNSSILASKKMRTNKHEFTQYLLGPEYFILDESYESIPLVNKKFKLNVVLTFGGSDPTDLTVKVLRTLLTKKWQNIFFQIILGPGYQDIQSIKQLSENRNEQFEVIVNPSKIFSFFQNCNLVVCAGGRTMYELFHLNKKFLPIATTEIEADTINAFIQQEIIGYGMTEWQPELFVNTMKRMLFNLKRD